MQILKDFNLVLRKTAGWIKLCLALSVAWLVFSSSIYLINYIISISTQSSQCFMENGIFEFILLPILIEWLCVCFIFWMRHRNILPQIMNSIKMLNKPIIEGLGIILGAYLLLYPFICSALCCEISIFTIPSIILVLILNKTLWIFIFLFWFGWNLLSILKTSQSILTRSKCCCEREHSDIPNR